MLSMTRFPVLLWGSVVHLPSQTWCVCALWLILPSRRSSANTAEPMAHGNGQQWGTWKGQSRNENVLSRNLDYRLWDIKQIHEQKKLWQKQWPIKEIMSTYITTYKLSFSLCLYPKCLKAGLLGAHKDDSSWTLISAQIMNTRLHYLKHSIIW